MSEPHLLTSFTLLFAVSTMLTLGMAAGVLAWQGYTLRREGSDRREGEALALEFAHFLCGQSDAERLRARAGAVRSEVFWTALERFSDNIEGDQWQRLTGELRSLPEVARVRSKLMSGSRWSRATAARRLGLLEDPGNRYALFRVMQAGPMIVSLTAGLALARLWDAAALEWLLQHPESLAGLSRHQLLALIKRFGRAALGKVRALATLEPSEAPLHLAALDALGLWKDEASRPWLERLLRSGELEARVAAARALGNIGAQGSLGPLQEALRDRAWQVRAQAARALAEFGETAAPAIPALAARTRDLSWWVRRHAAFSLSRLGPRGRAALASVAERDTDPFARDVAFEVLQALDWERESPGGLARVA